MRRDGDPPTLPTDSTIPAPQTPEETPRWRLGLGSVALVWPVIVGSASGGSIVTSASPQLKRWALLVPLLLSPNASGLFARSAQYRPALLKSSCTPTHQTKADRPRVHPERMWRACRTRVSHAMVTQRTGDCVPLARVRQAAPLALSNGALEQGLFLCSVWKSENTRSFYGRHGRCPLHNSELCFG